jgi:hypothetical protein
MLNGDSGYGNSNGHSVTGADKPPVSGLVRWFFPIVVWRP